MALPLVAWSFGGVESTTMAAFEAKTIGDIALASRSIHWILILLHFFYILGMMFTVPWDVSDVASFHPWVSIATATNNPDSLLYNTFNATDPCNKSTIGVVRAICNINRTPGGPPSPDVSGLANFVNVVLLYSVLSCGNAALYIASRTLYGLASSERVKRKGIANPLIRYLGSTRPGTGVPFYAVVFSWLIFCWAPFLGFACDGDWGGLADVSQVLTCWRYFNFGVSTNTSDTLDEAIPLRYV
jgi:amino acid permease